MKTVIKDIDAPIKNLFCDECRQTNSPQSQTRLSAHECGQATDCICWSCPNCEQLNFIADDLLILNAEVIGDV